MSRSRTWLSADAPPQASASPSMVTTKRPSGGTPSRADEHPGRAGEQEQGHDPRLRERQVVARGRERDRRAAEGAGDDDGANASATPRPDVEHVRPGRVAAPGDDAAERDRDEERPPRAPWPRGASGTRAREQRRSRRGAAARRARAPVRRARARARALTTTSADRRGAASRGQPEERARLGPRETVASATLLTQPPPQVVERSCARHVRHLVEVVRRRRRSCTTRACPPATGRCPTRGRCAGS